MKSVIGQHNVMTIAGMAIAILSILCGCAQQQAPLAIDAVKIEQETLQDMQMVDAIRDSGVRGAIISQHTLYPYAFVRGSAVLNELGERDLAVLASHYKEHGGELNVYRGSADPAMHNARVQHVTQALKARGVNTDRVRITDGQGGGESMSEDALRDMRKTRNAPSRQQNAGTMNTADQTQTDYSGDKQ